MKSHNETITIRLDMTIDDQGTIEKTSSQYHGHLFQKETFDVLIYDETLEDGSIVRNLITIHPHKVTIKRSGSITMRQQFLEGRQTESMYEHPYGSMHMETHTTDMTYHSMNELNQGKLFISYKVKLNGTNERKHELMISYSKEDAR